MVAPHVERPLHCDDGEVMTAAPEMVERIARAIYSSDPKETWDARGHTALGWDDPQLHASIKLQVRQYARAAIEAMREPTSRMLAAAVMSAVAASEPSPADYAATGAVLERLPSTGHPQARTVIAEIRRDYRAAVDAALGAP